MDFQREMLLIIHDATLARHEWLKRWAKHIPSEAIQEWNEISADSQDRLKAVKIKHGKQK